MNDVRAHTDTLIDSIVAVTAVIQAYHNQTQKTPEQIQHELNAVNRLIRYAEQLQAGLYELYK